MGLGLRVYSGHWRQVSSQPLTSKLPVIDRVHRWGTLSSTSFQSCCNLAHYFDYYSSSLSHASSITNTWTALTFPNCRKIPPVHQIISLCVARIFFTASLIFGFLHQVFSLARRCGMLTWHKASEHHIPEAWHHEAQAVQSKFNSIVSAFIPDWKLENAVGNRGQEKEMMMMMMMMMQLMISMAVGAKVDWEFTYHLWRKLVSLFVGLANQGKDIVFRFIIEYSSLMDFGPKVISLILYEHIRKMIFWLVLKLEISYTVEL